MAWSIMELAGEDDAIIVRPIGGEMTVCPYGGETTTANARLIAAAPDLLELVRELLDNAEIDALNEPELRPLCRRAQDVLAELA